MAIVHDKYGSFDVLGVRDIEKTVVKADEVLACSLSGIGRAASATHTTRPARFNGPGICICGGGKRESIGRSSLPIFIISRGPQQKQTTARRRPPVDWPTLSAAEGSRCKGDPRRFLDLFWTVLSVMNSQWRDP